MELEDNKRTCGFIETLRLTFCKWKETDIDLAIRLWGNPNVARYITAQGKLSGGEIMQKLRQEIDNDKNFGIQYWTLFQKSGGAFVGCCGLRPYDENRNILEIGLHLCEEYWKAGFAGEAALKVMEYAFGTLRVASLFAGHHPQNVSSERLLKKLGFCYAGHTLYLPTGLNHPSYFLNAEEYGKLHIL